MAQPRDGLLSDIELQQILLGAASLRERIEAAKAGMLRPAEDPRLPLRKHRWVALSAGGDYARFDSILASLGLSASDVDLVLGGDIVPESFRSDWTPRVNQILNAAYNADNSFRFLYSAATEVPFVDILAPFVDRAVRDLTQSRSNAGEAVEPSAYDELARHLLRELSDLWSPSLFFDFSVHRALTIQQLRRSKPEMYAEYVGHMCSGGLRRFLVDRPVLARLTCTLIDNWVSACKEMTDRLVRDSRLIHERFSRNEPHSRAAAFEPLDSDPHTYGRRAVLVSFRSGIKVVYKPREVDHAAAWRNLCLWIRRRSAVLAPPSADTIDCGAYGWRKWIEASSEVPEETLSFQLRRHGELLCLLYMLQAVDVHAGNVVLTSSGPAFVDTETLYHPYVLLDNTTVNTPQEAGYLAAHRLRDSVLSVGILPQWISTVAHDDYPIGPLNPQEVISGDPMGFSNVNSDQMEVSRHLVDVPAGATWMSGVTDESLASLARDCADGFSEMYDFLRKHRDDLLAVEGPIARFATVTARVIVRPTHSYATLLRDACERRNLRHGLDWSLEFEYLRRFLPNPITAESIRLQDEEVRSLELLDYPLFRMRAQDSCIVSSRGARLASVVDSPHSQVISRIRSASTTLRETQIRHIKTAFAAAHHKLLGDMPSDLSDVRGQPREMTGFADQAQSMIEQIADTLVRTSIQAGGGAAWIGAVPMPRGYRSEVRVVGYDLYGGLAGIAVFLSTAGAFLGRAQYEALARSAVAPIVTDLLQPARFEHYRRRMGVGGVGGILSAVYGCWLSGKILGDRFLVATAAQSVAKLRPDVSAASSSFDVVSGWAGAVLVALAMANDSPTERLVERASEWGQAIVRMASYGDSPAGTSGGPLVGFAHGAAGVAFALARLHRATGDRTFLVAARSAVRYERDVYRASGGRWPDLREGGQAIDTMPDTAKWCRTDAGICLSRAAMLDEIDSVESRSELSRCLQNVRTGGLPPLDHLCCGSVGQIESLFTCGEMLGDDALLNEARELALAIIGSRVESGSFRWAVGDDELNPGFFTGLSGLGYQLARMLAPERYPSVALLEG